MPSLIFHEGSLNENSNQTVLTSPTPNSNIPTIFLTGSYTAYNPTARRLMWFAVIALTLIICGLWAWALINQFYNIKWSASPEKIFMDNLKTSWGKSFQSDSGESLTTEELKTEVKENLNKLFAKAVGSATNTPEINTTTNN